MSKRTRTLLFYGAIIIFLSVSCLAVVFALGYQYDFVQHKFVQMGSFRVVANTTADVYVNENLEGSTSLISNNFSQGRLLPRIYSVRLEKEQYQPWHKNISVVAGLFTDVPKVVLMPEVLPESVVASPSVDVLTHLISPGAINQTAKQKILEFNAHEIWVNWTADTDYQPYRNSGDRELILRIPQTITEVQWYKDHEHVLYTSNGVLSFVEIDKRGGLNTYHIASIDGKFWYDANDNVVYAYHGKILYRIRL